MPSADSHPCPLLVTASQAVVTAHMVTHMVHQVFYPYLRPDCRSCPTEHRPGYCGNRFSARTKSFFHGLCLRPPSVEMLGRLQPVDDRKQLVQLLRCIHPTDDTSEAGVEKDPASKEATTDVFEALVAAEKRLLQYMQFEVRERKLRSRGLVRKISREDPRWPWQQHGMTMTEGEKALLQARSVSTRAFPIKSEQIFRHPLSR